MRQEKADLAPTPNDGQGIPFPRPPPPPAPSPPAESAAEAPQLLAIPSTRTDAWPLPD
jgi:hypothetical protein